MVTNKEKELVYFGASVAAGCRPCTRFHIKKVREEGATDEEVERAVSVAVGVRDAARNIMETQALSLVGIEKTHDEVEPTQKPTYIDELVAIAAAFAVNCTATLEKHISIAQSMDISDDDIRTVLDASTEIKDQAATYVNRVGQLREKVERLERLLRELEETQAQLVQSEKMAALGRLVASVVHEMNSPIGAISSATDVTRRAVGNIVETLETSKTLDAAMNSPRMGNSLTALRADTLVTAEAIERIVHIVNTLKSFAHLDEAPFQKVDLHEGLDDTLELMRSELGDRIAIVKEYGNLPLVECYPGELNQVFMNLLTNAIEAIETSGTVTIRTFVSDGKVLVQLVDTGMGISPEQMKNLFEPSLTKKGPRVKAGLGLFTSFNIAQKHGGEIKVESTPGEGSTFTVVLPIGDREEMQTEPSR